MKNSLVKLAYDDINPYMLSNETNKKLNTTHFVLGEERYRELQNRHANRLKELDEFAKRFGVQPCDVKVDEQEVVKQTEAYFLYLTDKEYYDNLFSGVVDLFASSDELSEYYDRFLKNK